MVHLGEALGTSDRRTPGCVEELSLESLLRFFIRLLLSLNHGLGCRGCILGVGESGRVSGLSGGGLRVSWHLEFESSLSLFLPKPLFLALALEQAGEECSRT